MGSKPRVEIVGIYPEKFRQGVHATFHVFLPDFDMDIRGGIIKMRKHKPPLVFLPQASGTDDESGKIIHFPVISFTNAEYEKKLREAVIQAVRKELKKNPLK